MEHEKPPKRGNHHGEKKKSRSRGDRKTPSGNNNNSSKNKRSRRRANKAGAMDKAGNGEPMVGAISIIPSSATADSTSTEAVLRNSDAQPMDTAPLHQPSEAKARRTNLSVASPNTPKKKKATTRKLPTNRPPTEDAAASSPGISPRGQSSKLSSSRRTRTDHQSAKSGAGSEGDNSRQVSPAELYRKMMLEDNRGKQADDRSASDGADMQHETRLNSFQASRNGPMMSMRGAVSASALEDPGSSKSLPAAVLVETDSAMLVNDDRTDVTDAERQRIREQAEEDARKKMDEAAVHATAAEEYVKDKDTSSSNKRSKSIMICIALLIVVGAIVGIVVGVSGNNSKSSNSSSSSSPGSPTGDRSDDGGGGNNPGPTVPPTPMATMPPTFSPLIDTDAPCTSNNFCECALEINETHIGESLFGSTVGATPDAVNTCDGISRNGAGVWYRMSNQPFTDSNSNLDVAADTPTQRRFLASLCERASAADAEPGQPFVQRTNFDSQISIFTGDRCDRLKCVAGNDQGGLGCVDKSRASFAFNTQGGGVAGGDGDGDETYYIYVHGFRSSRGDFVMELSELPNNLQCEDATRVLVESPVVSTTKGATIQPPEIGDCGNAISSAPGVWFQVEFDASDVVFVTRFFMRTIPITEGFIPQVSVFRGDSCGEVGCVGGDTAEFGMFPEAGAKYHILVHGLGNSVGDFVFSVTSLTDKGPPTPSPLPEDECPSAIGLPVGSSAENTLLKFGPGVDPIASCANNVLVDIRGNPSYTYRGNWFNTTGTGTLLRASTCNTETAFDTKISVIVGSCDDLQCVDANDDVSSPAGTSGRNAESCSVVEWYAHEGVEYKIIVHGSVDRPADDRFECEVIFKVTLEEVESSANQTCLTATHIPTDGTTTITILDPTIKTIDQMDPTIPIIVGDSSIASDDHDEYLFWYTVKGTGTSLTASTCHPGSMLPATSAAAATSTSIFILANDGNDNTTSCDDLRQLIDVTSTAPSPEFLVHTPCNDHMSATWKTTFDQQYFVVVKLTVVDNTALHPTFTLTVEDAAVNDKCRSAIGPLPFDGQYRTISTRSATRSFVSINGDRSITDYPTCPSTLSSIMDNVDNMDNMDGADGRDVWFSFIGNGMDLIASTCSIYTQFNTQMTMYRGDECTSLSCVATSATTNDGNDYDNDDTTTPRGMEMNCSDVFLSEDRDFNKIAQGRGRSIRWTAKEDVLYFIRVSGRDVNEDYGVVDFRISPSNDVCSRAKVVRLTAQASAWSTTDTTQGALEYKQCGSDDEFQMTSGMWYKVEGTGGQMYATTCNTNGRARTRVSVSEIDFDHYTSNGRLLEGDTHSYGDDPLHQDSMSGGSGHTRMSRQLAEGGPLFVDENAFDCDVLQCIDLVSDERDSCGSHHRVVWNSAATVTYYIMVQSTGTEEFDLEVGRVV